MSPAKVSSTWSREPEPPPACGRDGSMEGAAPDDAGGVIASSDSGPSPRRAAGRRRQPRRPAAVHSASSGSGHARAPRSCRMFAGVAAVHIAAGPWARRRGTARARRLHRRGRSLARRRRAADRRRAGRRDLDVNVQRGRACTELRESKAGQRDRVEPVGVRGRLGRADDRPSVEASARHRRRPGQGLAARAIAQSIPTAGSRRDGPCPTRSSASSRAGSARAESTSFPPGPGRHRREREAGARSGSSPQGAVGGEDVAGDDRAVARVEERDVAGMCPGWRRPRGCRRGRPRRKPDVRHGWTFGQLPGSLPSTTVSPARMRASRSGKDLDDPPVLLQRVERADVIAVPVGEGDPPDRLARGRRGSDQRPGTAASVVSTSVNPSSSRTRKALTKRQTGRLRQVLRVGSGPDSGLPFFL